MKLSVAFWIGLWVVFLPWHPVAAQERPAAGAGGTTVTPAEGAAAGDDRYLNVNIQLHDVELVTQDGRRVKFKSDVIGDHLVALTVMFTSCTTICPIYNAIFSQLQPLLGERLGKDVILVTITLDPTRDVPQRLKREAVKFKARPGWFYLTGTKPNVDQVLRGLGAYFADFNEHPPMALVGDGRTGTWKRVNGFPKPDDLVALLDDLKRSRGGAP